MSTSTETEADFTLYPIFPPFPGENGVLPAPIAVHRNFADKPMAG